MSEAMKDRPLRILHLGKYFHPDTGGIETVTKDIAQGAAGAGCEVAVLCFGRVDKLRKERWSDVDVLRSPIWRLAASQPFGWQYFREFLRQARTFDIIHVHVPNMLGALAVVTARVPGRVLVHWHSDVINKGWLGKLVRPLEWLLLQRADALVATSQAYADASPQLRRFRDKVHVVPIGIEETDVIEEDGDVADAEQGVMDATTVLAQVPEGAPMILAIGRLVPYKGFEVLVDAAPHLPAACRVVIVGGGERRAELEARIRERQVGDRVVLAGRLDDHALRLVFRRATIFCLPSVSRAEAFGVVLLEAMARGLPIVASDIPGSGVPWVNRHGVTGLNVPAGDARALAAAVRQLLADPQRREQMGREARHRFQTEFTAAVATRRFLDLYAVLAGRGLERPAT
jgi:glycosyltransferase involved in cell wall biosynthesis